MSNIIAALMTWGDLRLLRASATELHVPAKGFRDDGDGNTMPGYPKPKK